MRKLKRFMYVDKVNEAPVMVFSKNRPSEKNIPKNGVWRLKEFFSGSIGTGKWEMPCFPEVSWPVLKELKFVGEVKP